MSDKNFVERVLEFNRAAGRPEQWDTHLVAAHIGFQMEELSEKLKLGLLGGQLSEAQRLHIWTLNHLAETLHLVGMQFKEGFFDSVVEQADRNELLDADVDISVFSVGSMMVQGANVLGATNEVCEANEKKKFDDGQYHLDANGKIMKPAGWKPRDLTKFVGK